jgi:hypothetical protein
VPEDYPSAFPVLERRTVNSGIAGSLRDGPATFPTFVDEHFANGGRWTKGVIPEEGDYSSAVRYPRFCVLFLPIENGERIDLEQSRSFILREPQLESPFSNALTDRLGILDVLFWFQ